MARTENQNRRKDDAKIEKEEALWEEYRMDDAEVCIVAFGVAARVSQNAIDRAREKGIKVGMIRPITLWPFPKEALKMAVKINQEPYFCAPYDSIS